MESLKHLSGLSSQRIPHIEALVQLIYRDKKPISAAFDTVLFQSCQTHRVGVFLIDVSNEDIDVPFDGTGMSHFVEVVPAPSSTIQGWAVSPDGASARVNSASDNVDLLIHDILLDIAVFNSMDSEFSEWSDLDQRRTISELKVRFAVEHVLPSFYGPILDDELRYFSFASACRTSKGFDYVRYLEIWREFSHWLKDTGGDAGGKGIPPVPPLSTLDQVKKLFRLFDQMPLGIRQRLAKLPSGKHHILFPLRRPANIRARDSVATFFKRPHWRRGVFRLVDDAEFEQLVQSRTVRHWLEVGYLGSFTMVVP